MAASAILGYVTVALDLNKLNQLGVIGPVIAGIFALIGKAIDNAAASRRQRRELRSNRRGQSAVNGFVIAIVLVAGIVAVRSYNSPRKETGASSPPVSSTLPTVAPEVPTVVPDHSTVVATTVDTALPITVDEAKAFVASYLDNSTGAATVEQAWAMFTVAHAEDLTANHGGVERFKGFWRSVDTVSFSDTESPTLTEASTPHRAVLKVPLLYKLHPNNAGVVRCTDEHDIFTIVRVNGTLQIDGYDPHSVDVPCLPA